jgi:hypothetical protein
LGISQLDVLLTVPAIPKVANGRALEDADEDKSHRREAAEYYGTQYDRSGPVYGENAQVEKEN